MSEDRKPPFSHPLLYGYISFLIVLILQSVGVVCAFALKGNIQGQTAALIPIHGLEFIALLFAASDGYLAWRLKVRKRLWIIGGLIFTILATIVLLFIESLFF